MDTPIEVSTSDIRQVVPELMTRGDSLSEDVLGTSEIRTWIINASEVFEKGRRTVEQALRTRRAQMYLFENFDFYFV